MNHKPKPDAATGSHPESHSDRRKKKAARPYQPKKPRYSIKTDKIHPGELAQFNPTLFCEQCSHYDSINRRCTIGYRAQHTRDEQMALYNLSGRMALCRFLEID